MSLSVIADLWLWWKALHVIAAFAWMAALLYLPRLFVYHADARAGSELADTLKVMERKLARVIMWPAGLATWGFGLVLVVAPGTPVDVTGLWFPVKLAAVSGLAVFHLVLERHRGAFATGTNRKSSRYFRRINEIPTILLIVAVVAVVVRPFG